MKKVENGFTLVELLVVIGILGILMGALFPAISSAMLSANSSAMAMKGRNLFVAITQCNTDRSASGLPAVWPNETNATSADDDDQNVIGAKSSGDFFKYLFDFQNKNDPDNWKPYVDVDVGVLSGCGVPGVSGTEFNAQNNLAWLVINNYVDSMDDVIPVLVTRNVASADLGSAIAGTVKGDESNPINFGGDKGDGKIPSLDKLAWILVRKSGGTSVIKKKYSKYSVVFNHQGFNNSSITPSLSILKL